jgi:hypothetical protein
VSLPEGVSTCNVTFGKALSQFGTVARLTGKVTMDRRVIHAATGYSLNPADEDAPRSDDDDLLSFAVPHVDQEGFLDPATQLATTHWYYTLSGKIIFAGGGKTLSFTKTFQPLVGQTDIDLDFLPDGTPTPGVTAPTAEVSSVAGQTGHVSTSALRTALGVDTLEEDLDGKADLDETGRVGYPQLPEALSPSGLLASFDENVPPVVAQTLSDDPTIRDDLTARISQLAASDIGIVTGVAVEDPEYAIPFVDEDRYAAGGVLKDGSTQFERLLHQPQSIPFAAFGEDVPLAEESDYEYAVPFVDDDGYIAGGLLKSGEWHFRGLAEQVALSAAAMTRSDPYRLAFAGDSLFDGYSNAEGHWTDIEATPGQVDLLLPDHVTVFNRGYAGWAVDEVAIRIGAYPLSCTVSGGQIPASGSVTVTIPAGVGWVPGLTREFAGTLAGVPGTLTRTGASNTSLTFARTASGSAVPVGGPVTFVSAEAVHETDTMVVCLGRNDFAYNVTGTEGSVAAHVLAGTARIWSYLREQVQVPHVLFVGTLTKPGETTGTSAHNIVTAINRGLASTYGGRYWDMRDYMVNQAIYDLGITPTASDLAAIAGDTMPPSIVAGGTEVHYTKAAATVLAAQIYRQLVTRGWV